MVGDGDHEMVERQRRLRFEQRVVQAVLIHGARRCDGSPVGQKGEPEKARLLDQAVCATVQTALSAELREHRVGESPHCALPAPQFVVEIEHGRHQPGPHLERRSAEPGSICDEPGRALQQHFPLGAAEQNSRAGRGPRQPLDELRARHKVRQQARASGFAAPRLDRLSQQLRRRARGHDNRAPARVERTPRRGQVDERRPKCRKIAGPDQGPALKHCACGGH
jgi:hypothetical protein